MNSFDMNCLQDKLIISSDRVMISGKRQMVEHVHMNSKDTAV